MQLPFLLEDLVDLFLRVGHVSHGVLEYPVLPVDRAFPGIRAHPVVLLVPVRLVARARQEHRLHHNYPVGLVDLEYLWRP